MKQIANWEFMGCEYPMALIMYKDTDSDVGMFELRLVFREDGEKREVVLDRSPDIYSTEALLGGSVFYEEFVQDVRQACSREVF